MLALYIVVSFLCFLFLFRITGAFFGSAVLSAIWPFTGLVILAALVADGYYFNFRHKD